MERKDRKERDNKESMYLEKLIRLSAVSKTVKGGRRRSFDALVVVGDQKGKVGYGMGKANDVTDAIRKATDAAKKNMITVSLKNTTIPHEILGEFKSASVLLRPASEGTGVIAGGAVRAVCDAAGIKDILSKSLGSKNTINTVKATFNGLASLKDAKAEATARGKNLKDFWG